MLYRWGMEDAALDLGARIARRIAGDLIGSGLADSVSIESTGSPVEIYARPLRVLLDQRHVLGPWAYLELLAQQGRAKPLAWGDAEGMDWMSLGCPKMNSAGRPLRVQLVRAGAELVVWMSRQVQDDRRTCT